MTTNYSNVSAEPRRASNYLILSFPEIMNLPHTETRWAIPGLLPEGLTILGGNAKIGKSWLVLNIALAVAKGSKVLGNYDTEQGDVLYLALEDDFRRLTKRTRIILGDSEPPTSLYGAIGCRYEEYSAFPTVVDGGLEIMKSWIVEHPTCRLVIVDTAVRFLPPSDQRSSAYQADYAAFGALQTFAMENHIALIVVHHTKKQETADIYDSIIGSRGVTGSSDANWVLRRVRGKDGAGKLNVTGKDIPENEFAAFFNETNGTWTLQDDSPVEEHSSERLKELHGEFGMEPFTVSSAQSCLGLSPQQTARELQDFCESRHLLKIEKIGKAQLYKLTDKIMALY